MILTGIFIIFINKLLAEEVLYDSKIAKLLNDFNKKNSRCRLEIKRDSSYFSIRAPNDNGPIYAFNVPNEELKDIYKDIGGQHSQCKHEKQEIICLSEGPSRMPENNAQSFQHLELKLDKNQNIIEMHLYKIEKRYLFSHELPMFEKKYAEVFCPEKNQATPVTAISEVKGAKEKEPSDSSGLEKKSDTVDK